MRKSLHPLQFCSILFPNSESMAKLEGVIDWDHNSSSSPGENLQIGECYNPKSSFFWWALKPIKMLVFQDSSPNGYSRVHYRPFVCEKFRRYPLRINAYLTLYAVYPKLKFGYWRYIKSFSDFFVPQHFPVNCNSHAREEARSLEVFGKEWVCCTQEIQPCDKIFQGLNGHKNHDGHVKKV